MIVSRGDLVLDADAACDGEEERAHFFASAFIGVADNVSEGFFAVPGTAGCGCVVPCGRTFASAHLKYSMYWRISSSDRFWLGIGILYLSRSCFAVGSPLLIICSGLRSQRVSHPVSRRCVTL